MNHVFESEAISYFAAILTPVDWDERLPSLGSIYKTVDKFAKRISLWLSRNIYIERKHRWEEKYLERKGEYFGHGKEKRHKTG
jgi:hypothetical protein